MLGYTFYEYFVFCNAIVVNIIILLWLSADFGYIFVIFTVQNYSSVSHSAYSDLKLNEVDKLLKTQPPLSMPHTHTNWLEHSMLHLHRIVTDKGLNLRVTYTQILTARTQQFINTALREGEEKRPVSCSCFCS